MNRNLCSDKRSVTSSTCVCVCVCVWVCVRLPGGNRHFSQTSQGRSLSKTDKSHKGLVEEIHLTNQDVGRLCVSGDLLHKFVFQLQPRREGEKVVCALVSLKDTKVNAAERQQAWPAWRTGANLA